MTTTRTTWGLVGKPARLAPVPKAKGKVMPAKVTVIVAGDTVYVFDAGDERIAFQVGVCIGADPVVGMVTIPVNRLSTLIEYIRLSVPTLEVEDCRIN